ncbi:MAG: ComEC/Rec2 family competence protein [Candidatus Aminicenantales bacterium]
MIPWWLAIPVAILGVFFHPLTKHFSFYLTLAACVFLFARSRAPQNPNPSIYRTSVCEIIITQEPLTNKRATGILLPPYEGKITIFFRDSAKEVRYGDKLLLRAKIKPFSFPRNPGLVDYNQILFKQGFVGSVTLKQGSFEIISRNHGNPIIARLIMPSRRYLSDLINRWIGGIEANFLLGILLGVKSSLPKNVRQAISNSGTMHLLAVSGLHVSIVVFALSLLLGVFRIRGWVRFGILTGATLFYIMAVGWHASAIRAGFMTWATLLGFPVQRRVTPLTSLAVAGIIILLIEPFSLFNPGTQLSFSATAALLTIPPRFKSLLSKIALPLFLKKFLLQPTITSIAATLGTAPLLLHHFYRFQPLTFISNILLVPLTTIVLPLALLLALVNLITPAFATIFSETIRLLLQIMLLIARWFGNLSWTMVEPGKLSWFGVLYLYGLILLSLNLKKKWGKTSLGFSLVSGLIFLVWKSVFTLPASRVTFLDPGRGDATLIEDRGGKKLLIDAGIDGTNVLRDFLLCRGIRRIDAALITHPDRDHYGGLLDLEETQKIDLILVPTLKGDSMYQALLERQKRLGTKIFVVSKGTKISGFDYKIDILWPDATTQWLYSRKLIPSNPVSNVALIKGNGFKMLFPGDCEYPEITNAVAFIRRVNLLKSPHHGSRKGNKKQLFDLLKPEYVVVMGRHPTPAGLETLLIKTGIKYINTRHSGGVIMQIPPTTGLVAKSTSIRLKHAGRHREFRKKDKRHRLKD